MKHGYVSEMANWPWSCYQDLLAAHGQEWIDDLRRDYPLKDFGRSWDDYDLS